MRIVLAVRHMEFLLVLLFVGCGGNQGTQPARPGTGDSDTPKVSRKPEELILGCWKNGSKYLEFRRDGTVRAVDKAIRVRKIDDKEIRSDHREYDGVYRLVEPTVLRLEFPGESPILLGGLGDHPISFLGDNLLTRKLTESVSDGWERVDALPTDATGDISATATHLRDEWEPHKIDRALPGRGWQISIDYLQQLEGEITITFNAGAVRRRGHDQFSLKLEGRRVGQMITVKKGDNTISEIRFRVEGQSLFIEEGMYKDSVSGDISLKGEWRRKPEKR